MYIDRQKFITAHPYCVFDEDGKVRWFSNMATAVHTVTKGEGVRLITPKGVEIDQVGCIRWEMDNPSSMPLYGGSADYLVQMMQHKDVL